MGRERAHAEVEPRMSGGLTKSKLPPRSRPAVTSVVFGLCATVRALLSRYRRDPLGDSRLESTGLTAVRPDRLVAPERHGWAGPEGRRLGQLERRLEMSETAEGCVGLNAQLRRIAGPACLGRVAGGAKADEPHPAPTERSAHVIAAAFPCSSAERHERAQRRQVTSRVVAGRGRHPLGSVGSALNGRDAGDRLGELLPPWTCLPGA